MIPQSKNKQLQQSKMAIPLLFSVVPTSLKILSAT